jgi:hypothetical protein
MKIEYKILEFGRYLNKAQEYYYYSEMRRGFLFLHAPTVSSSGSRGDGSLLAMSRWLGPSSQKILQNFSDFSSHRIFGHMHEALNIDKK